MSFTLYNIDSHPHDSNVVPGTAPIIYPSNVFSTFPAGVLYGGPSSNDQRKTFDGWMSGAHTNQLIQESDDLSDATWTASNLTVSQVADSYVHTFGEMKWKYITTTAVNATISQTLTTAPSKVLGVLYMPMNTAGLDIELSTDNGSTFTVADHLPDDGLQVGRWAYLAWETNAGLAPTFRWPNDGSEGIVESPTYTGYSPLPPLVRSVGFTSALSAKRNQSFVPVTTNAAAIDTHVKLEFRTGSAVGVASVYLVTSKHYGSASSAAALSLSWNGFTDEIALVIGSSSVRWDVSGLMDKSAGAKHRIAVSSNVAQDEYWACVDGSEPIEGALTGPTPTQELPYSDINWGQSNNPTEAQHAPVISIGLIYPYAVDKHVLEGFVKEISYV